MFLNLKTSGTAVGLVKVGYISDINTGFFNQALETKFSGILIYNQVFRKNWAPKSVQSWTPVNIHSSLMHHALFFL